MSRPPSPLAATTIRLASALLVGCIPAEPPPWVVTEPIVFGFQTAVVEPGPYSEGLLMSEGYTRAEAMPLDVIELRMVTAAPPGAVVQPPIWLACPTYGLFECFGSAAVPLDCPVPLPLSLSSPCRLGAGSPLRVELGDLDTLLFNPNASLRFYAIGSRGGEVDPETCLQRFLVDPPYGLEDCLIGGHSIYLGPEWWLRAFAPFIDPDGPPVTEELLEQPPDTNPIVVWFVVTRLIGGEPVQSLALPGSTVEARPGERITVEPQFTADAEQDFYFVHKDKENPEQWVVDVLSEELRSETMVTVDVGEPTQVFLTRWTMPDEPVTLFFKARDGRQGRAFAELHFSPSDEAP